jgi:hypothetical protein
MAPEQERGEPVDARADVWAAGMLLAHMLGHGRADAPAAPPWLAQCVARACAEAPEARFADAATMRAALVAPSGRGRRVAALALVGLVLAAALAVWQWRGRAVGASPQVRAEALLATSRPGAHPVDAAEAPALDGTYVDEQHPRDSDARLEVERRGGGYHVRMGGALLDAPLAGDTLFSEGEARVYRVGDDVYLLALVHVLREDREHLSEFRLEPSGALFEEVLVARDHRHVANGANVRGYRYTRAPGPGAAP